jgi:hypothetical protein
MWTHSSYTDYSQNHVSTYAITGCLPYEWTDKAQHLETEEMKFERSICIQPNNSQYKRSNEKPIWDERDDIPEPECFKRKESEHFVCFRRFCLRKSSVNTSSVLLRDGDWNTLDRECEGHGIHDNFPSVHASILGMVPFHWLSHFGAARSQERK